MSIEIEILCTDGSQRFYDGELSAIPELLRTSDLATFKLLNGRVMFIDRNGTELRVLNNGSDVDPSIMTSRVKKPINEQATLMHNQQVDPPAQDLIYGDVAIVQVDLP